MNPVAQRAIACIDRLIQSGVREAWHVAASQMPDRDHGQDLPYETKVEKIFQTAFDEVSEVLAKRYGEALAVPDSFWTREKVLAWNASGKKVVCLFCERDDWDAPLLLNVGITDLSSYRQADDPWDYARGDDSITV